MFHTRATPNNKNHSITSHQKTSKTMTVQIRENLIYDGFETTMTEWPLEPKVGPRNRRFLWTITSCWRAYVGTWEIVDEKLFLVSIEASTVRDGKAVDLEVADLFPGQDRVFAEWYTGPITAEHPEANFLGHSVGDQLLFDKEIVFQIERGRLVGMKVQENAVGRW